MNIKWVVISNQDFSVWALILILGLGEPMSSALLDLKKKLVSIIDAKSVGSNVKWDSDNRREREENVCRIFYNSSKIIWQPNAAFTTEQNEQNSPNFLRIKNQKHFYVASTFE